MSVDNALVMILAGGEGKRLFPLTQDRAKALLCLLEEDTEL